MNLLPGRQVELDLATGDGPHPSGRKVQADDLVEQDLGFCTVEQSPQWNRHVGRKCGGRDLVQQRLEQEISTVDQRDACDAALQRLGDLNPGKSAADDDHAGDSPVAKPG